MKPGPLTPREKRILVTELRGAMRDGGILVNSVLSALSFLSLAGFELSLPPLVWLTTHWSRICQAFWNFVLFWLPVEISLPELTTESVTFFMLVGLMFLRGRRAGFVGLSAFSIEAQDFFARLLYYGLVAFVGFRLRHAAPLIVEIYSDRLALQIATVIILILVGYGIFRLYVATLRRFKVIPRLLARPWLVLGGPLFVLLLEAVLPSHGLEGPAPDELSLLVAGVSLLLLQLLLVMTVFFFGTPLACWFVRVAGAMVLVIASFLVLDTVWLAVQGPAEASGASEPSTAASQDVDSDPESRADTERLTPEELKAELIRWIEALEQTGTRGAMRQVNLCYAELENDATIKTLDRCMSVDLFATESYEPKARYHGSVTDIGKAFFSGDQAKRRIILACERLNIEPEPCRQRLLQLHEATRPLVMEVIRDHL